MNKPVICKLLQRQTYDILSHRQSVVWCFVGFVLLTASLLHFGETMLIWSKEKYAVVFNSYRDNIAAKNFESRLCEQVPIDVVYTWVNGTDPKVSGVLANLKQELAHNNQSSNGTCSYLHCVPTHMVILQPVLPHTVTLSDLDDADPMLSSVTNVLSVSGPIGGKQTNITLLVFNSREAAAKVAKRKRISIGEQNYTVQIAYISDDWLAQNAVPLKTAALLTLVPAGHTEGELFKMLPRTAQSLIEKIFIYEDKSLAILTVSNKDALDSLLRHDNFTLDNKVSKLVSASLILHLVQEQGEISSNRFTDNEELRYSLRSLEMHAPWIRHVYIVTNGQIPHWLNLDNPRVTIITHEEIFSNQSHLPTFSSPAIESHLHKIPGLSKKFLYLNDDVMFGKDVWPDDFYTHAKGQKIYLTWPVPDCSEGCPNSWIRDGYCDKACNNSECQWDGGDCEPGKSNQDPGFMSDGVLAGGPRGFTANGEKGYCYPSCANSWLADRYCDQACNVKNCAYDAGDCGTDNFHNLHGINLNESQHVYELPQGVTLAYFNLTSFFTNGTITEGLYEETNIVRVLSVSLKYKVLACVLYPNVNATQIRMTFRGKRADKDFQFSFRLLANTRPVTQAASGLNTTREALKTSTTEETISVTFEEFPEDKRKPKIHSASVLRVPVNGSLLNVSEEQFPSELRSSVSHLKYQLQNDEITLKGFAKKLSTLLSTFNKRHADNNTLLNLSLIITQAQTKSVTNANREKKLVKKMMLQPTRNETRHNTMRLPRRRLLDIASRAASWEMLKQTSHKTEVYPAVSSFPPTKLREGISWNASTTTMTITQVLSKYETPRKQLRHLMDTFGDSLRHVNKLYNEAFGYVARKVPAHVAHLIDINVMERLHKRFNREFDVTSSHKIRSSDDMQFAFSYYYFLMSEKKNVTLSEIFDKYDTDKSGTWSDREIRSVMVQLNDLPLDYFAIKEFEDMIINCSCHHQHTDEVIATPAFERYYNSSLPLVSKQLIMACSPITSILEKKFGTVDANKYEILGEDEVAFKMIQTNLSQVISQIDDLRKHPKKFICLNDNINHSSKEADMVRAVIQDYYESLFPVRSQFELPPEYRNKFLHVHELYEWRRYRDRIRYMTYACLAALIIITLLLFYSSEVKTTTRRKVPGRRETTKKKSRQQAEPFVV